MGRKRNIVKRVIKNHSYCRLDFTLHGVLKEWELWPWKSLKSCWYELCSALSWDYILSFACWYHASVMATFILKETISCAPCVLRLLCCISISEMVSCGLSWRSLKEAAMFISGNILVMVVPQITIAPTSLLLSFRGPKGMTVHLPALLWTL